MASFTDSFNGTTGDLLSARSGWSRPTGADAVQLSSSTAGPRLTNGTTAASGTWHAPTSQPSNPDQYASAILKSITLANAFPLGVRCDTSTALGSGYLLRRSSSSDQLALFYRNSSGGLTSMGTFTSNATDLLSPVTLRVVGTSITVELLGAVVIGPVTDTNLSSGSVAMLSRGGSLTNSTLDEWDSGDVAGASGINGAGSGTADTTGASAATVQIKASASGSVATTGSSTGTVPAKGAASGSAGVTGLSTASIAVKAAATGTAETTGSATGVGVVSASGTASGTANVTGSGAARLTITAVASGASDVVGATTARVTISGSAASTIATGGAATAVLRVLGSASGAADTTGSATGDAAAPVVNRAPTLTKASGPSSIRRPYSSGTRPRQFSSGGSKWG